MKRLSKKIILITLSALFIIASLSVTFAWLFAPAKRDLVFDTSVRLSYFESGDGSETSPYEIKYPLQLYYLAWLQDIGYFNDIKDTSGKVIPTYFYLSDNLDMDGWVLPSIGTAEHPFLGHFDGTNHVVSNLIIDNNQAQMKDPVTQEELGNEYTVTGPNAQIIGFFGVIGEYNGVASTNSSVVSAFNFALDNVNVKSTTPTDNKTLIGIVAGYLNGEIGNIFVADNCKVTIAETLTALTTVTTTISSYTVVGYATDKYKKTLNSETSTTDPLFDPAKGNGWGGSIDMLSLYNRLIAVRNSRTNVSAYPTEVHYNGNTTAIATSGTVSYIAQYGDKSIAGQYMMVHYDDQTDTTNFADAFNYIYGYDQLFRQTRLEFNVVDGTKEQFKIYSNGRYLYTTNGTSWGNTTNVNNAQYFQLSDEGYLFTIYNDRVYYVTVASTADGTSLTLSNDMTLEADLTQWTKDSGALRLKNTANRYLVYNGGWIISSTLTYAVYIPKEGAFSICSEDVYLNATNTLSTSNTNTTYWYLKDNHLMTYYGSTPYYVNANGTSLSYDTTASTDWVKTVDSLSTTVSGNKMYLLYINGNYRLVLDNSTNQATSGGFYYKHNGYYLNLTSETAVGTGTNGTVEEAATIWKLDASNHIYTTYKGNKYYLNRNGNNFTVNASTTANTQWTMINGFATLEISSVTYYLVYDSGWKLAHILDDSSANSMTFTQNTWYTIAYNSNYLNLNNSQSFARGTSQPTFWSAPTNTTSTSLYTTYNGTRYYLTGTTLGVSSADNNFNTYSKWRKSGNSIYYYSGNTSYYLKYNRNNNNQWLLRDSTNNRDRDGYGYNQLTITAVTVNTISYNGTYKMKYE